MGLRQKIAPAVLPVSLAELRAHCRIDLTGEDAELLQYLRAAVATVERETARQLVDAQFRYTLPAWPKQLHLPRAPLQSVASVRYLDDDGDRQTLSPLAYALSRDDEPGSVLPVYGESWPTARPFPSSIWIDYWAGLAAKVSEIVNDTLTIHGRTIADGDEIVLWTLGDLPAGLAVGRTYYAADCVTDGPYTDFALSLTDGGASLTGLGSLGDGLWVTDHAEQFLLARQAVLLLAAHSFEAREATTTEDVKEIPLGAQRLLEQLQYGAEFYSWEAA